jgi:hypothetical protein
MTTNPSFLASLWHDCGDPLWSSASRSVSVSPPNSIPTSPSRCISSSSSQQQQPFVSRFRLQASTPSANDPPVQFIAEDDMVVFDDVSIGIVRFRALRKHRVAVSINRSFCSLLSLDSSSVVALLNEAVHRQDSPVLRRWADEQFQGLC